MFKMLKPRWLTVLTGVAVCTMMWAYTASDSWAAMCMVGYDTSACEGGGSTSSSGCDPTRENCNTTSPALECSNRGKSIATDCQRRGYSEPSAEPWSQDKGDVWPAIARKNGEDDTAHWNCESCTTDAGVVHDRACYARWKCYRVCTDPDNATNMRGGTGKIDNWDGVYRDQFARSQNDCDYLFGEGETKYVPITRNICGTCKDQTECDGVEVVKGCYEACEHQYVNSTGKLCCGEVKNLISMNPDNGDANYWYTYDSNLYQQHLSGCYEIRADGKQLTAWGAMNPNDPEHDRYCYHHTKITCADHCLEPKENNSCTCGPKDCATLVEDANLGYTQQMSEIAYDITPSMAHTNAIVIGGVGSGQAGGVAGQAGQAGQVNIGGQAGQIGQGTIYAQYIFYNGTDVIDTQKGVYHFDSADKQRINGTCYIKKPFSDCNAGCYMLQVYTCPNGDAPDENCQCDYGCPNGYYQFVDNTRPDYDNAFNEDDTAINIMLYKKGANDIAYNGSNLDDATDVVLSVNDDGTYVSARCYRYGRCEDIEVNGTTGFLVADGAGGCMCGGTSSSGKAWKSEADGCEIKGGSGLTESVIYNNAYADGHKDWGHYGTHLSPIECNAYQSVTCIDINQYNTYGLLGTKFLDGPTEAPSCSCTCPEGWINSKDPSEWNARCDYYDDGCLFPACPIGDEDNWWQKITSQWINTEGNTTSNFTTCYKPQAQGVRCPSGTKLNESSCACECDESLGYYASIPTGQGGKFETDPVYMGTYTQRNGEESDPIYCYHKACQEADISPNIADSEIPSTVPAEERNLVKTSCLKAKDVGIYGSKKCETIGKHTVHICRENCEEYYKCAEINCPEFTEETCRAKEFNGVNGIPVTPSIEFCANKGKVFCKFNNGSNDVLCKKTDQSVMYCPTYEDYQ